MKLSTRSLHLPPRMIPWTSPSIPACESLTGTPQLSRSRSTNWNISGTSSQRIQGISFGVVFCWQNQAEILAATRISALTSLMAFALTFFFSVEHLRVGLIEVSVAGFSTRVLTLLTSSAFLADSLFARPASSASCHLKLGHSLASVPRCPMGSLERRSTICSITTLATVMNRHSSNLTLSKRNNQRIRANRKDQPCPPSTPPIPFIDLSMASLRSFADHWTPHSVLSETG